MVERIIGGRTFRTRRVLATEALRLQIDLAKMLGVSLDKLPAVMAEMSSGGDTAILAAIGDVLAQLDPDRAMSLLATIAGMAEVAAPSGLYDRVDLDAHFSASPAEIYPFIGWVLKEVLGGFFGGKVGATLRAAMRSV